MRAEKDNDSAADRPRVPKRVDSSGISTKSVSETSMNQENIRISKGLRRSGVPILPPTSPSRQQSKLQSEEYSVNVSVPDLERSQYPPAAPGAVAVGTTRSGSMGDELSVQGSIPVPGTMRDEEQPSRVLLNAQRIDDDDDHEGDIEEQQDPTEMVRAEPIIDEHKAKTFIESVRDRRVMFILLFGLLLVATALVTGLIIGLGQDISKKTRMFGTFSPTPVPITESPSSSPTLYLEFDPPTPEECRRIAGGYPLENQEDIVLRHFEIQLDVSLSQNDVMINDPLTVLDQALQRNFATSLSGCDDVDYEGQGKMLRRRLLRKNVVSNAVFKTTIRDDSGPCRVTTPNTVCFRMVVTLDLYLKGEERIHKLLGLITNVFDRESLVDALGLGAPFHSLRFAAIKSTDPTDSPTQAPTLAPSLLPSDIPVGDQPHNDDMQDDQTDDLLGGDDFITRDDALQGDDFFQDGDDNWNWSTGDDAFGNSGGTDDFAVDGNDNAIDDFLANDNGADGDDFFAQDDFIGDDNGNGDDFTIPDAVGDDVITDDIFNGGGQDEDDNIIGLPGDDNLHDDNFPRQDDTFQDEDGDFTDDFTPVLLTDDSEGDDTSPQQDDAIHDDVIMLMDDDDYYNDDGTDDIAVNGTPTQEDDATDDFTTDDNTATQDDYTEVDDNAEDDFTGDDSTGDDDTNHFSWGDDDDF